MTTSMQTDPRPYYRRALGWAHRVIASVPVAALERPTPCAEYDVRALLGHLVATVRRAYVVGEGAEPFSVPSVVTGIADDGWPDAFAEAAEKLWTTWDDDRKLAAPVTVPWGVVPGRAAL